jgi:hypothetical protein
LQRNRKKEALQSWFRGGSFLTYKRVIEKSKGKSENHLAESAWFSFLPFDYLILFD